ncbi:MAG TPA: gluconate 2-dehydrogenase subunit 3 family protein [Woeseiaceae bacterium]|nr:gluconate 2-dehydrogenase subunit 3 family protein [Woeseiaceae bacterium]
MPSLYVAITRKTAAMTKNNNELSRRRFLISAGSLAGASFVRMSGASIAAITQAACTARDDPAAALLSLSAEDALDIEAIAARIIPSTDTPGATEAGVVHFFDSALAGEMRDKRDELLAGLAELNAANGAPVRFADLAPGEQDARLHAIQDSDFFGLVREMTIFGFFAMSSYGGNRDHVGWDLVGFRGHNGAWEYPFGYYDATVHGGGSDGE